MWNYRNSGVGYGGLEIYGEIYMHMVDMWRYLVLLAPDLQHLPIFSPKLRKQITGNVSENVLFGD